jgi:7-carboxy-7-deazaguanine synthase (Cx14CxxC type)
MAYVVKEVFYTLQGEGAHVGRPAVFVRFTGCNLWTGREEDRASATCSFCDTDFVGTDGVRGGRYETPDELVAAAVSAWPGGAPGRWLVCTGGEPSLQLDEELVRAFQANGFPVAIETNGTRPLPRGLDWVCVSPKAGSGLAVERGDELKAVVPQALDLEGLLQLDFRHFFLQPMDGPDVAENTRIALRYCLEHPPWRLSLQTHKTLGIP